MDAVVTAINDVVWSPALVYLCLLAGLYFTIRSRVVQLRKIGAIVTYMFSGKGSAIAFGGPGAVFWMWIVAFFGASTSFVESTLGQIYKERDRDTGEYRGGPAFFIERAYRHTKASGLFSVYAMVFAFVTVVAMSFLLPGVQANGISSAAEQAWGWPK